MSKDKLCIHHRYLKSGPPRFHLVCWTHSAMFSVRLSPLRCSLHASHTLNQVATPTSTNCDNHNSIPFETTITVSQKYNLPQFCTTYIKSVSLYIFLRLPLLSYFGCYFSSHRSSERVGRSLCNTHLFPTAAPISYTRHAGREQHLKTRLFLLYISSAKRWTASTVHSRQGLCKNLWATFARLKTVSGNYFLNEFSATESWWLLNVPKSLTHINSSFGPHGVFMCFVRISDQKAITP